MVFLRKTQTKTLSKNGCETCEKRTSPHMQITKHEIFQRSKCHKPVPPFSWP